MKPSCVTQFNDECKANLICAMLLHWSGVLFIWSIHHAGINVHVTNSLILAYVPCKKLFSKKRKTTSNVFLSYEKYVPIVASFKKTSIGPC